MTLRILLWLSLAWLPILMFFLLRNDTKFKKNIVVEVTLPFEARTDKDVLMIIDRYKRRNLWANLSMFLVTIPFLFFERTSLLLTLWMTWVLMVLIVPLIPYAQTNAALKKIKIERGWKKDEKDKHFFDLSSLASPKWLSPWVFIPAIAISFLPILWDRDMWLLYLTLGLTTTFFYFSYRYLYRNKFEMIDQNVRLTRVLTQVRRRNWGVVWMISAYGSAVLSLVITLFKHQPTIQILAIAALTCLIIVHTLRVEFKTRKVQEKLTAESGKDWYVDYDDYWLGGIIYYNPNDSRLLINSRVGINSTINLAKTSGKVIAVFVALILLLMPLTGLYIKLLEEQPISLELTESTLIAHRGNKKETLLLSEISDAQLLDELPERMTKIVGNGLDRLLSGTYSAPGFGRLKVSLDPKIAPFLLVELKDGTRYLFGARQPGEVEAIFQKICNR